MTTKNWTTLTLPMLVPAPPHHVIVPPIPLPPAGATTMTHASTAHTKTNSHTVRPDHRIPTLGVRLEHPPRNQTETY